MELLGHMRNGTFVEIGGNDGLSTTNTYHLERCLGWQGLLIEGHPVNFHKMARARPGALNLGIAVCREHGLANFSERAGVASGINSEMDSFHRKHFNIGNLVRRVPCGPLGDWFTALRLRTIDFFSLDVEGAELVVLQTLNWEALTIGVLLVECAGAGHYGCKACSHPYPYPCPYPYVTCPLSARTPTTLPPTLPPPPNLTRHARTWRSAPIWRSEA